MNQINFVEVCGSENLCLSRPYPFKCFKDCLPQILLGSFLNTLTPLRLYFIFPKTHFLATLKGIEIQCNYYVLRRP